MRPTVVFDALGTLFDPGALDSAFEELGGDGTTRRAWFERLLDSARCLTILDAFVPFADLAVTTLTTTLAQAGLDREKAPRIAALLDELPAFEDAAPALDLLIEAGVRAVVLSNGSGDATRKLVRRAGLEERVDAVYSVEQVRAYKPDPRPYLLVATEEGKAPADLTLVAAHGWDVLGAHGAGLGAVWLDRDEHEWPFPIASPGMQASDLVAAAETAFSFG